MSLISRLWRHSSRLIKRVALRSACAALAFVLLSSTLVSPLQAQQGTITLNFKDADIDAVIGAFGVILNRTFSIDPRVRGKITLEAPKPLPREQAYQLLLGQLRSQGFTVVEGNGFTRVVPEADAKLQGGPVIPAAGPGKGDAAGDQIVTQIFEIKFESASGLVPVLRPLIAPNNTIIAYPGNNTLVITDYASNLKRISRIIATLDSPRGNDVEVIPIKHAVASDVAVMLTRVLDDTQRASAGATVDAGQRAFIMADPRTNTVLIRSASPQKVNMARSLIAKFDQPSATPGDIHVVYLRNAEAAKLAQTLRAVLAGDGSGASGGASGGAASSPTPAAPAGGNNPLATAPLTSSPSAAPTVFTARGATIAADATLNALIITAAEPVYRNIRAVIDRLDVRRVQVFIETLIVEVRDDRSAELGIQWQALGALGSGKTPDGAFGGTNFSGTGRIFDVAANPGAAGAGLNIGFVRGTTSIAGNAILNIPFLLRALGNDTRNNIIATPNLVTLDNEEARIVIGRNVPFVTGTYTNQPGGNASPFQTVERKDVGTILKVKPQVSESGAVRLQIAQELSTIDTEASKGTGNAGLVTSKRSIESTVIVDDGQLFVLGGLIQDEVADSESRVPILGRIPILGQLFRSDSRARAKSNLLVFLRPIVIRGGENAYAVTADRYDYIRQVQGDSRLPSHWALPDFPNPAMPVQPAPPNVPREERRNEPVSVSPQIEGAVQRPAPIQGPNGVLVRPGSNEVYVPLPGPRLSPPAKSSGTESGRDPLANDPGAR